MSFRKTANLEPLGFEHKGQWSKSASSDKVSSFYMEGGKKINVEAVLDTVADPYQLSRDPNDYVFIPLRANSADRPNNNMDGWEEDELRRFDNILDTHVYRTYNLKPHFVNHNASDLKLSRGVILDSHLNMQNDADDKVKVAVFDALGKDVDKDVFVELLVGVDSTKDPSLAGAYKNGSVQAFSMGCDVTATMCTACDNIATTDFELCKCVRQKHARIPIRAKDGVMRLAWEKCLGTIFQEISAVDDPADETAMIQDGLLKAASSSMSPLDKQQLQEISNFIIKNASNIPDTVAGILNRALQHQ